MYASHLIKESSVEANTCTLTVVYKIRQTIRTENSPKWNSTTISVLFYLSERVNSGKYSILTDEV
jgi:hypothetical protein